MTTCYAVVRWIKAFQQVFTKSWQGGCAAPPHDAVIRVTQRRGELTGPLINTWQISDIGLEYLSNAYLIQSIFSLKILNFTFSASCNSKLSRRLPIFTCVLEYFIIILVMQYFNYIFSFPKKPQFLHRVVFLWLSRFKRLHFFSTELYFLPQGFEQVDYENKKTNFKTDLPVTELTHSFPSCCTSCCLDTIYSKKERKKTTPITEARVCLNS